MCWVATKVEIIKLDTRYIFTKRSPGSETIQRLAALRIQMLQSKDAAKIYEQLNDLSELLKNAISTSQKKVDELNSSLPRIETDEVAGYPYNPLIKDAQGMADEQARLLDDVLGRTKDLEDAAIRVSLKEKFYAFNVLKSLQERTVRICVLCPQSN